MEQIKQQIMAAMDNLKQPTPSQGQKSTRPINLEAEAVRYQLAFYDEQPSFIKAQADADILNSLFAWVWRLDRYNTAKLDYNKGLWLYGSVGRGKTLALAALRRYIIGLNARHPARRKADHRLGTYWTTASELANKYAADGQVALEPYYQPTCCLFVDELGREPNPANNFGTKMNVLQFLLQMRYDNRHTCVTHVTTNLGINEVATHYGDYVADRCLEMFNFIEFNGESLRK